MDYITEKFAKLGCDNAPGQESLQKAEVLPLEGDPIPGTPVDFSHGDVDAHVPTPGSFEVFAAGVEEGGAQAYTPYRGRKIILEHVASKLSAFTGAVIDPAENVILAPGTQGALFLAMGSNIVPGDKVAIVEPDYFANRKMVEFFGGEILKVVEGKEEKKGDIKDTSFEIDPEDDPGANRCPKCGMRQYRNIFITFFMSPPSF